MFGTIFKILATVLTILGVIKKDFPEIKLQE